MEQCSAGGGGARHNFTALYMSNETLQRETETKFFRVTSTHLRVLLPQSVKIAKIKDVEDFLGGKLSELESSTM